MKLFWLQLALVYSTWAQIQLYQIGGSRETAIYASTNLGTAPAGDALDVRFRLRNIGNNNNSVQTLALSGDREFTLSGEPNLPFLLTPGASVDFRITFRSSVAGEYRSDLMVNGRPTLLLASASAAVSVLVEEGGTHVALASQSAPVDFGRLERPASATRRFFLENPSSQALSVTRLTVSGENFRITTSPPGPIRLNPRESASFVITYQAAASGTHVGTLQVDERSFRLSGVTVEPPFPRPSIALTSPTSASAKQERLRIELSGPSRAAGRGELRLELRPSVPNVGTDSTVVFAATGTRSMPFEVREGESQARFGSAFEAVYQTGATAGTIVFTAEVGGFTASASVGISPDRIALTSARASRVGGGVEVQLTALDNTRTAGSLSFTFYDTNGQVIGGVPLRVDSGADFRRYFDSSTVGGVFSLRALFPVAGDASKVAGVEVDLANGVGVTRSDRLAF